MTGHKTTNLSDAIRNLIVCDRQFAWNGETTLKLPELLDLQARGWLIEGDENNEFSLTVEGEAVIARALQQAVPAELAEQQGVELPPLPEAFEAEFTAAGRSPVSVYTAEQMQDYARAALAATGKQQVGEVQEDGLATIIAALEHSKPAHDHYYPEPVKRHADALAHARALAARQPRGQEPALFANRWEMEHGTAPGLVAMRAGRHLGIREFFTVPLYTAPPAQGIDLENARDQGHDGAIRYVLGYLNGVGDWGSTQYVEILNACGRERIIQSAVQDGELEFTGLGRWVAERGTDQDRALIDQLDAAPGVGNG